MRVDSHVTVSNPPRPPSLKPRDLRKYFCVHRPLSPATISAASQPFGRRAPLASHTILPFSQEPVSDLRANRGDPLPSIATLLGVHPSKLPGAGSHAPGCADIVGESPTAKQSARTSWWSVAARSYRRTFGFLHGHGLATE